MLKSNGHGTTKLMMGETVMLPRILKSFLEWWNTFFPFWFWMAVLVATIIVLIVWSSNLEGGIHYVVTPRSQISMRRVLNPFTMSVNHQNTSFRGLTLTCSSKASCYILSFWGVPVYAFCDMMQLNWTALRYTLFENVENTFKNKCIASGPVTRLGDYETQSIPFEAPPSVYNDARMSQERFIHLLVVAFLTEESIEHVGEPFIFLQATIIKFPEFTISVQERSLNGDPNISANVSRVHEILGVYVRESNSRTTGIVQRVYDGSLYSENVDGVEVPLCVACCERAVNIVIFPCLHASLCRLCFTRCNFCPICRGTMWWYFTLGPEIEIPQD